MRFWVLGVLLVLAALGAEACRCSDRSDVPGAHDGGVEASAPSSADAALDAIARAETDAAPAPTSCRAGRTFDLDLARWKADLTRARDEKTRNSILTQLGLDDVPDDASEEDADGGKRRTPVALATIDIAPAALASDAGEDRIVTVRYKRARDTETGGAVRIAVLRKLGSDKWCSIAEDFSIDQDLTESACLGVDLDRTPPIAVSPVHLQSAACHTLRVIKQNGHCDTCGRSGRWDVAFYDAGGFAVKKLFEHALYETYYSGCPFGPISETRGSIELTGGFPREIVALSEVTCHAPDPDLPEQYRASCTPAVTRRRYVLRADQYAEVEKSELKPPLKELLAIEDSDFADSKNGAGWGNRCVVHLEAHRLDEARAACRRGLAANPSPSIAGALHYNLARVEQAAEDTKAACAEIVKSLAARPGNAAAERKTTELGCSR